MYGASVLIFEVDDPVRIFATLWALGEHVEGFHDDHARRTKRQLCYPRYMQWKVSPLACNSCNQGRAPL